MSVLIRSLNREDYDQVKEIDQLSFRDVSSTIDSPEYAWGIFDEDKLAGYCTIGGAEEIDEDDSWLLSDVFIKPEYRNQGYAKQLINEVLDNVSQINKESVFITILDDRLREFYEDIGFEYLEDGLMVKNQKERINDRYFYEDAYGDKIEVFPVFNMYSYNNNLYLGLECDEDGYRGSYCTITVNICELPYLQSAIDITYSEEQKINFLLQNGFGKLTDKAIRSGYCNFPVFEFSAEKLKEINPDFFKVYSLAYGKDISRLEDRIKNVSSMNENAQHKAGKDDLEK